MELDEHIVIKGLKLRFSLRPASFLLSSSLAVPGPVIHCIQCPSQAHTIKVPTGMPGYICTLDLWHMDSAFFCLFQVVTLPQAMATHAYAF